MKGSHFAQLFSLNVKYHWSIHYRIRYKPKKFQISTFDIDLDKNHQNLSSKNAQNQTDHAVFIKVCFFLLELVKFIIPDVTLLHALLKVLLEHF